MKHFKLTMATAATMGFFSAGEAKAFSDQTFVDVSNNIVSSSAGLTNMIALLCYIGGIGLAVAGLFKLKAHVDNPGQAPLKDAMIRLGIGGGLLALPFIVAAMQGTIAAGGQGGVDHGSVAMNAFTVTGGP